MVQLGLKRDNLKYSVYLNAVLSALHGSSLVHCPELFREVSEM